MTTTAHVTSELDRRDAGLLRAGVGLMCLGAIAFIGYAVVFFARNFTDDFLELGIGHERPVLDGAPR